MTKSCLVMQITQKLRLVHNHPLSCKDHSFWRHALFMSLKHSSKA